MAGPYTPGRYHFCFHQKHFRRTVSIMANVLTENTAMLPMCEELGLRA
jgi:hypothetical protein